VLYFETLSVHLILRVHTCIHTGIEFADDSDFLSSSNVFAFSFIFLVNKANLVHNFSWYVYFFSLHVSGDYVPIISRNNCIYDTLHSTLHTRQSFTQNN